MGFLFFKKERGDSASSRRLFISTSPCHWVCERLVHCQGDFFFYPWFHMVWTGLHVAPHATANVFSIRCLISRELASDEACWQRNGRESFRRLHQMAALLRHLGQNLVDGELAAGAAFFFFFFSPFLLSLPLWQNVPDLTFIKFTFDFFHTLQWGGLTLLPLATLSLPLCDLSSQAYLPWISMGQCLGVVVYVAFGLFVFCFLKKEHQKF